MSLIRSSCDGVSPAANATGGTEVQVASALGVLGQARTDTVYGNANAGQPSFPAVRDVCDEEHCSIAVDGRFKYTASAQRRVFGAGVPLQVGKLYSSSKSVNSGAGWLYGYYVGGTKVATEQTWPQYLSLASGLDDNTSLNVRFQVQQATTGKYAACATSPCPAATFAATADPFNTANSNNPDNAWIDGVYDTASASWKLPYNATQFTVGGDYAVKTQLITIANGETKQYGGANGFPLWVDWKKADSVFVALSGNDANTGLSYDSPVQTVTKGLQLAATNNRSQVLLSNDGSNRYAALDESGGGFPNNVTITGGLNALSWLRSAPGFATAAPANPKTGIGIGYLSSPGYTGVTVSGQTGQIFRQLDINSGPPGCSSAAPTSRSPPSTASASSTAAPSRWSRPTSWPRTLVPAANGTDQKWGSSETQTAFNMAAVAAIMLSPIES